MTLGVRRGDEVVLLASGTDARAALNALAALLAQGAVHESPTEPSRKQLSRENPATPEIVEIIRGVTASSGIAVGRAVQNRPAGNIDCRDRRRHRARKLATRLRIARRARKNRGAGIELEPDLCEK